MATIKTLVVKLVGDIAGFQQDMQRGAAMVEQAGRNMQSAGAGITAGVTLPLVGAGGAALKFANDYNAGMANVASLGAEAQQKVGEWKPLVQDVALSVGKGTEDMTSGLYNVVSAFGATDDSLAILESNARAGAAGLATTADSINLTSAVTKGYGDTSAEAVQKAADLALQAVALGQTTFPELAGSVGKVVPLMAELGGTQEELFGTMATLTGVTGGAAEVSTQLRGVLQALMAPTADMTGLINSLGYESGKSMLSQNGLHETILAIVEASEATGTPLAKYIGSIEGQTAALALAGPQSDVYIEKLAAMGDAVGSVDAAFAAQTEGVNKAGFSLQQLRVRAEVLAQRFGDALIPVFLEGMNALEPLLVMVEQSVTWFSNLDPAIQRNAIMVAVLVAAIGPLLFVLGTMVAGIGALGGVFAVMAGPVGLVIGLIAALAAAWATNWNGIRDVTDSAIAWIRERVSGLDPPLTLLNNGIGRIRSTITGLYATVQSGDFSLSDLFGSIDFSLLATDLHSFSSVASTAAVVIGLLVGRTRLLGGSVGILRLFGSVGRNAIREFGRIGRIATFLSQFNGGLKILAGRLAPLARVFAPVTKAIMGMLPGLSSLMSPLGIIIGLVVALAAAWHTNFLGIRDIADQVFPAVAGYVQSLVATFQQGGLSAVLEKLGEDFGRVITYVQSLGAVFAEGGISAVLQTMAADFAGLLPVSTIAQLQSFYEQGQQVVGLIVDFFSPTLARLRSGFGEMVEGLAPLPQKFAGLLQAMAPVAAFIGVVLIGAFNLLLEIVAAVMPRVGAIIGGVVDVVTAILNTLTGVIRGVVDFVVAIVNGDWSGAWAAAQGIVGTIRDGIEGVLRGLWTVVSEIVMGLVDGVIAFFTNLWDVLVGNSIVPDTVNAIIEWFINLFTGLVGEGAWVPVLISRIIEFFTNLFTGIVGENGWIPRLVARMLEFFTGLFSGIVGDDGWIPKLVNRIDEQLGRFEGIITGALEFWNTLVDAIQGFWTWLQDKVFNFNINLPELPDWATPGSPIPLHTRWADFHRFLQSATFAPQIDMSGAAALVLPSNIGSPTIRPNFDLPGFDNITTPEPGVLREEIVLSVDDDRSNLVRMILEIAKEEIRKDSKRSGRRVQVRERFNR